jgi:hypothetical protein
VQVAKTQLRAAADAAARAGVVELGSISNVQSKAIQYAGENACDGTAVTITSASIDFVDWNPVTRTYTVLTGTTRNAADAVRVRCDRTGANGIALTFGGLIGMSRCNVHAEAIATLSPPGYGLVGLNYIKLSGNSSASYWSSSGTVGGNAGNIASNGNITSTLNSTIQGTVWTLAGATVSGVTASAQRQFTTPLSYPNGSSSPYSTSNNDNGLLPTGALASGSIGVGNNKTYAIQAGHYLVNNFTVNSGGTINLQGPVTFYIYGSLLMNGVTNTNANLPKNLSIVMIPNPSTGTPPGTITVNSQASLYANIYAPQSDITLSGSGAIYGSVVGKSITMSGSSDIFYDLNSTGGSGVVQLVK